MRHVFPQGTLPRGLVIVGLALLAVTGARAQDDPVPAPDPKPAADPPAAQPAGVAGEEAESHESRPPAIGDPFPTHLPMVPLPAEGAPVPAEPVAEPAAPNGSRPAEAADGGDPPKRVEPAVDDETGSEGATPAPVVEAPPGQSLADLVGETPRPLVLVFWSSRCVVCERYGEALANLVAKLGDDAAVVLVATGSEQSPEAVREALANADLAVTVFLDPERATAERLGVRVTPSAFVVGADNVLRYRGPIDDDRRARPRDARPLLVPAIEAVVAGREVESGDVPPFGSAVR